MTALTAHDPASLPWAPDAKFTENNVPLEPGDGLWGTIDKQGPYKLYFADREDGQVGFYGSWCARQPTASAILIYWK